MPLRATKILREAWEVEPRLVQLSLSRAKLLTVRNIAIGAAADATPFHPANAAGTFSYQHGTFGLRNEFVDDDEWKSESPNNVEVISNERLRVRVVFANVDVACDDEHEPKARSGKGAGSQRLCASNSLFGDLPRFAKVDPLSSEGWTVFYLMVDPEGAVELSCAKVENHQFANFIERLYLSDGSDLELDVKRSSDDSDAQEFDPQVARK